MIAIIITIEEFKTGFAIQFTCPRSPTETAAEKEIAKAFSHALKHFELEFAKLCSSSTMIEGKDIENIVAKAAASEGFTDVHGQLSKLGFITR